MRYLPIFFLTFILLNCETPKKDSVFINVQAPGVYNGMRAYLKVANERSQLVNVDTAIVLDEKFYFDGKRTEPRLEYLFIDGFQGNLPLIVENGDIEILINKDSLHASKVKGTETNQTYQTHLNKEKRLTANLKKLFTAQQVARQNNDLRTVNNLSNDINNASDSLTNLSLRFIDSNKNSYVSAILLNNIITSNRVSLDSIESGFNKLSENLKTSTYGLKVNNFIVTQRRILEQQKNIQIGGTAPNFKSKTPDGEDLALNDIKGKVTIIDFWASWCGPCRRENPNVVKVYNKYHEKGLEIISVSLDREGQKERWLKAIDDDKLNWYHVSNLKYWQDPVAQLYSVRSIPSTFILDADGKIIAKNLRGQALEDKIAEILN